MWSGCVCVGLGCSLGGGELLDVGIDEVVGLVCGGRYVGMSYEEAQKVLKLDTYSKTKYLSVLKMVSHPKIIHPPHEQSDGK